LPATGVAVLDEVTKSNGIYNFNNQQLIAINGYYAHDALTVIRTYPFSYVIGLIISNRLFFSPSNTNVYFSAGNRAAVKPMEQILNPVLYGVGATSKRLEQPHFGFTRESFLEVNTSVPLMVLWVVVLGYGYIQVRQGLMSNDPARRSHAVMIGFIVVSALYLYAVGTAVELGENYRYRFNIEPLFFVLTATAATGLVRFVRQRIGKRMPAASVAAPIDT
jgi:hypothetical protein